MKDVINELSSSELTWELFDDATGLLSVIRKQTTLGINTNSADATHTPTVPEAQRKIVLLHSIKSCKQSACQEATLLSTT